MSRDLSHKDDRRSGQAQRDAADTCVVATADPRQGSTQPTCSPPFHHLLYVWLSPSFPTGAFAYSHGLEMAAERGLLTDDAGLADWLAALIAQGSLRNDLLLLAAAHRAAIAADPAALATTNALALALQPGAERHLETTQQGGSFLSAVAAAWPHARLPGLGAALGAEVAYPIAVGVTAAAHGVPLDATLAAFAFAFAGTLTSAAIRLGLVGQTGAQATLATLSAELYSAAHAALNATLDDIGSATFSADLCSLEHETQYSRLFRS